MASVVMMCVVMLNVVASILLLNTAWNKPFQNYAICFAQFAMKQKARRHDIQHFDTRHNDI
jgi:hypothetical protein